MTCINHISRFKFHYPPVIQLSSTVKTTPDSDWSNIETMHLFPCYLTVIYLTVILLNF